MADDLISYVLPIRRADRSGPLDAELVAYLQWLRKRCAVIVVDGSSEPEFRAAHRSLDGIARHVAPEEDLQCANGKVRGVLTGWRRVQTPLLIIADDDVRYDENGLRRVEALLAEHDLVAPQNFFDPRPWHAVWDTGRTLVNRCFGADPPGTIALRRELLDLTGGYDGNVLFENLELIRTARAVGARCTSPLDLYVRRVPPTWRKFAEQRVRQAYDEFARPHRMALALATVPLLGVVFVHRPHWLPAIAASVAALAERGRRLAGGRSVFPPSASLLAPAWVLERGICSWVALAHRLTGGCPYAGGRLRSAGTRQRTMTKRHATTVKPV